MESQQPEAKPQPKAATDTSAPVQTVPQRRYPKPPPVLVRLALHCLKPESWAAAAQYPLYVTIVPLILAILLAATIVSASQTARTVAAVRLFASTYDKHFAPMEINSDGVLSLKGDPKEPIIVYSGQLAFLVDPANKISPDTVKSPLLIQVTDKQVIFHSDSKTAEYPIWVFAETWLPAPGSPALINGASIATFINNPAFYIPYTLGGAIGKTILESLWVLLMLLIMWPMPVIGARTGENPLAMPKRAAYRLVAAVLIPLILFGSLLDAAGYSIYSTLGVQGGQFFWFVATLACAAWAGLLAKSMYATKPARRRQS